MTNDNGWVRFAVGPLFEQFLKIAEKEGLDVSEKRIDSAAVEKWNGQTWETLASVSSIGPRRLVRLDKPVTAQRLRLRVTQASASPVLTEFGVFMEPG